MILFRNIATAFLINGNDFLLSKRSMEKKIAPGAWYGVGGHIEPIEINNPFSACLREIYEETGIKEKDIDNLKLRYILLNRSKDEIVVNYIYFGTTKNRQVIDSDEGKLYWIPKEILSKLEFFEPLKITLVHYLETENSNNVVLVGIVGYKNNKPFIGWNPV